MIKTLSHITFIVNDLNRMANFLITIFDAKEIYSSNGREFSISKEKFFMIGEVWIAIMEGKPLSERSYNHVAFKVDEADFNMYVDRIKSLGVEILKGRDRIKGEGESIYFYDYDHHLFEIHTETLNQRLASYQKMK